MQREFEDNLPPPPPAPHEAASDIAASGSKAADELLKAVDHGPLQGLAKAGKTMKARLDARMR